MNKKMQIDKYLQIYDKLYTNIKICNIIICLYQQLLLLLLLIF